MILQTPEEVQTVHSYFTFDACHFIFSLSWYFLQSRTTKLFRFFNCSGDYSSRIMPKRIQSSGRKIVLSVRDFCEKEKANKAPLLPLGNVRQRVAAMTGM